MKIYCDTSWWISLRVECDIHHQKALDQFDQLQKLGEFIWTPLHTIEVNNSLRQLEYQKILKSSEAHRLIGLIQNEIKKGYWVFRRLDLQEVLDCTENSSQQIALKKRVRAMDLLHIGVARSLKSDRFITFDRDQELIAQCFFGGAKKTFGI